MPWPLTSNRSYAIWVALVAAGLLFWPRPTSAANPGGSTATQLPIPEPVVAPTPPPSPAPPPLPVPPSVPPVTSVQPLPVVPQPNGCPFGAVDGLDVTITPPPLHHVINQVISFTISSAIGGHVLIWDAAPDRTLTLIFPNPMSSSRPNGADPQVTPDHTLTVPDRQADFAFRVQPPTGQGSLIVMVLGDYADVADVKARLQTLAPLAAPELADAAVSDFLCHPGPNGRRGSWSLKASAYNITSQSDR